MFRRLMLQDINYFMIFGGIAMIFLPSAFSLIGLSSIGPTAGGLFSTMQGAGIVSGSVMAILQSFVMSGRVMVVRYLAALWLGIVSIFSFWMTYFKSICYKRI